MIELAKGVQRVGAVGPQHRILPGLHGLDSAAQDDDSSRFVPARELETVLDSAPALVAGALGLVRVVADLSPTLLAIQRFDGGVDVQYPRGVQCRLHAAHELGRKPGPGQAWLCCARMRESARRSASSPQELYTSVVAKNSAKKVNCTFGVALAPWSHCS